MPSEDSVGESHGSNNSSFVAHETMVGSAASTPCGAAQENPCSSQETQAPHNRPEPPDGFSPVAGMQVVRQALQRQKLPQRAVDIIMKSWRSGSQKQYATYLNRWIAFCHDRATSVFCRDIHVVLDFLVTLADSGLGYSAINTARSALSVLLSVESRDSIGNHPLIKRFLKGIYEKSPSVPRYTMTWDINIALKYLRELSPIKSLSLKMLTLKLTLLLALVTAQRVQSLQLLKLSNLTKGTDYIFAPEEHLKHNKPGRKSSIIAIRRFSKDKRLCPITVLEHYLSRTKEIRKSADQVLISYTAPHKPVPRDTIRRWIVITLKEAGIDTDRYRAHSTRAAATTSALINSAPVDDIQGVQKKLYPNFF